MKSSSGWVGEMIDKHDGGGVITQGPLESRHKFQVRRVGLCVFPQPLGPGAGPERGQRALAMVTASSEGCQSRERAVIILTSQGSRRRRQEGRT